MPSLITNNQFFRLTSTVVTKRYSDTVKEEPETYSQIMNEMPPDKRPFIQLQKYTGMGLMSQFVDGNPVAYDEPSETTSFFATFLKYGLGYKYTEDANDDDYAKMLGTLSGMLAYSRIITEEYLYWNIFNQGFNGAVTGTDGVSLFSNAHPVTKVPSLTQNNTGGTMALSPEGLFAAKISFKSLVDERGLPITRTPKTLVVPLELEMAAKEMLGSDKYPYSNENRPNVQKGAFSLCVSRYLSSPTAWFVMAGKGEPGSDCHPLFVSHKYKDRQQTWTNKETSTFGHKAYFRSIWGFYNFLGAYGSQGS